MKQPHAVRLAREMAQPPLGGCVLKLTCAWFVYGALKPAAFRRLCVETKYPSVSRQRTAPAAFRRLCVETAELL